MKEPLINCRDFLLDELFIYWRLHSTKELDAYWGKLIENNPQFRIPIEEAIRIFDSISHESELREHNEIPSIDSIKTRIKNERHRLRLRMYSGAAAALLLILLVSSLYFFLQKTNQDKPNIASIGKVMNNEHIQFISGNTIMELDNDASLVLSDKDQKAVIQTFQAQQEISLEENEINTLIVPYGKRSSLLLADGSRVNLNSGTKMTFPSRFSKGKREITVEGEIFIDVTKRKDPFIIHTPHSEIIVYGTSFNVSSYIEDAKETVVLVEGSVEVKSNRNSVKLQPNEMAEIEENSILHKQVDASKYTGWINGYLLMERTPLDEVLKKIGRYYNVEFGFSPELELQNQTCSGKLFLSDNLTEVLESFAKLSFLQYNQSDKEMIIIYK